MKQEIIDKCLNYLITITPLLMIIFSTILFANNATDTYLPQPIDAWIPYRNFSIAGYLLILVIVLMSKKLTKKPINISWTKWIVGLILSVFSYALGGFIVDLMRIVIIFASKILG
jgi:hypothetical protein